MNDWDRLTALLRTAREAKNGTAVSVDGEELFGFVIEHDVFLEMHTILNSESCPDPRVFAWLIEAAGPCYLCSIGIGETKSKFVSVDQNLEWGLDANKALRFARKEDAERAMLLFRKLKSGLFPTCFPHFPKPVEHGWITKDLAHD